MNELGHILREAREARGLTLAEVQDEIRINTRFLEALENGDYAELPTPVHVRGFLRNYARFLGLDPQPLLSRYNLNQARAAQPTEHVRPVTRSRDTETAASADAPLHPRPDQPFFEPVNMEVAAGGGQSRGGGESFVRLAIIIALIVSLYLIGSQFVPRLFGDNSNTEALTESINNVVQSVLNNGETAEVTPEPTDVSMEELAASGVISSTNRNILPTPTATRPSLPATMDVIDLRLDILERTWMEVTIDGDVVFSGNARQDDSFEWTAEEEARINTGNAIGIFVTINDVELGPLGERGEAKEEFWRTTN